MNTKPCAILVRANKFSEKLVSLAHSISSSPIYDVYLCANQTNGAFNSPLEKVIPHSVESLSCNFPYINSESRLIHCSDILFYYCKMYIPDYKFYIMIEDDVHFPFGAKIYIESVINKVFDTGIDLLATHYQKSSRDWVWSERCYQTYGSCFEMLFPFVGLSSRAIDLLRQRRQQEFESCPVTEKPVYCEAFVATTLSNNTKMNVADLNDVIRKSYNKKTFTVGAPMYLGSQDPNTDDGFILHPVCDQENFLSKGFSYFKSKNDLRQFLKSIYDANLPLSSDIVKDYIIRSLFYISIT